MPSHLGACPTSQYQNSYSLYTRYPGMCSGLTRLSADNLVTVAGRWVEKCQLVCQCVAAAASNHVPLLLTRMPYRGIHLILLLHLLLPTF